MTNWPRVKKCPICGHARCLISPDGDCIKCYRVANSGPTRGDGWFHRIDDHRKVERMPRPQVLVQDMTSTAHLYHRNLLVGAGFELAEILGVTMESLWMMGCGITAGVDGAWSFPMCNEDGKVIGIRLRQGDSKWSVTGSTAGIFRPIKGWWKGSIEHLFICEGPTDTMTMWDMGFLAVGRPSANSGNQYILKLIERMREYLQTVTVFCDADQAGRDGAERLKEMILNSAFDGILFRGIIEPTDGSNDVREWVANGATKEDVERAVKNG